MKKKLIIISSAIIVVTLVLFMLFGKGRSGGARMDNQKKSTWYENCYSPMGM